MSTTAQLAIAFPAALAVAASLRWWWRSRMDAAYARGYEDAQHNIAASLYTIRRREHRHP